LYAAQSDVPNITHSNSVMAITLLRALAEHEKEAAIFLDRVMGQSALTVRCKAHPDGKSGRA